MTTIHPIILAGTVPGTDWVFAPGSCPTPFKGSAGQEGSSLFQATCRRVGMRGEFETPAVICSAENHESVKQQLASSAVAPCNVIVTGRDLSVAAAISIAVHGARYYAGAVYVVMAPDHIMEDDTRFVSAVSASAGFAVCGRSVVFGAGLPAYSSFKQCIVRGACLEGGGLPLFEVAGFCGHPTPETLSGPNEGAAHFWNTGILVANGPCLLDAVEEPVASRGSLDGAGADTVGPSAASIPHLPEVTCRSAAPSFTGQIAERIKGAALHVLDAGWQSAGLWSSIVDRTSVSQPLTYRLIGGGVVDPRVVDELLKSPEVVIVAGIDKGPEVAHILRRSTVSETAPGPPPAERASADIGSSDKHQSAKPTAKLLRLLPGGLMESRTRAVAGAQWVVLNGLARVRLNNEERYLSAGETYDLAPAAWQQVENAGMEPLTFLELNATSLKDIEEVTEWKIPLKTRSNGS